MVTSDPLVVQDAAGLHARPAARLVELARSFSADVKLRRAERSANCKSLISVLALGATVGTNVWVEADGSDEEDALHEVVALLAELIGRAGGAEA